MPLCHLFGFVPHENTHVVAAKKLRLLDLVLRRQESPTGPALKKVGLDGLPESDVPGGLPAEDDHVGKVTAPRLYVTLVAGALSEDTARGEDLLDGTEDHLGSG